MLVRFVGFTLIRKGQYFNWLFIIFENKVLCYVIMLFFIEFNEISNRSKQKLIDAVSK